MMKKIVALALLMGCIVFHANAQNKMSKEELATYETEINKMVNYLQETLNFIGDPTQTAQEKEIIFSQSFTKIFQDDQVQVEDDLDSQRSTNLSKDVQAYLKDIDFFFQHATFTFSIQSIANLLKEDGSPYFKVTMNRQLVGKTVTNDSINDVRTRFIEINLDKKNNDLKIASIYTTKINEKQTLTYWWNTMPSAWKSYFGKDLKVNDTIPLKNVMQINENDFICIDAETWKETVVANGMENLINTLRNLSLIQTVDVSDIKTITTLEPLSELSDLITLNICGTNVNDLTPLRNANKLKILKANDTHIADLSPLKYDIMLEELDIDNTEVTDLSSLETLNKLEKLDISNTQINSLEAIKFCPNLGYLIAEGTKITQIQPLQDVENIIALNINNTQVRDLSPLSHLKTLQSLKISNTLVKHLEALKEMESLKELYCSNTSIGDLSPLKNHRYLSKVYCDNTLVTVEEASEFSKENPFTLVIYDTHALEEWWNNLPIYWKAVFSKQISIDDQPATEQLHEVINMTELNLSGNEYMQNLIPVSRLTNLVSLDISNTEITHLEPLRGMTNLERLNLENTHITDLRPLANMSRLKYLNINNTPVEKLECLAENTHLEIIWAENSNVRLSEVRALKSVLPKLTVVFQTNSLQNWWDNLDETWQSLLKAHVGCANETPSALELQRIQDLKEIRIEKENTIQSLEPIRDFIWLEKAQFTNQDIRNIDALANKNYLSELLLQNNPITNIEPLEYDTLLTVLNIENTQVNDLSQLEYLSHIRILNASGTPIKSLKPLSKMNELEELLINNTAIKNLSPIENLPSLKLLKIYNTKVKSKTVTNLQQKRFDLNIVYY